MPRLRTRPVPASSRREFLGGIAAAVATGVWCRADAGVGADTAGEIRGIKLRLAKSFAAAADAAVPQRAADLVATLRADGSWPDLDAGAPPLRGQVYFRLFPHVHRLRKIAGWWRREAEPASRRSAAAALHRGLGWWLRHRPMARASWYQEIGVPTQLGQMALLAEEVFSAEERAAVIALLRTAVRPDGGLVYSGKPATGQNLIWEAHLQILAGCLTKDAGEIERYARRAEQEMQPTLNEGLQPDYSFHQHGPQLYAGGYGQDFAGDCARLIHALAGTRFAYRPGTVRHLVRFVLDGQQWMTRGRHWDFGVVGRWVAWPEGTQVASDWRAGFPGAVGLAQACRDLAVQAGARRGEMRALAARLEGRAAPEVAAPVGCRAFWRSEYFSCARREFHFGVRMSSRRVYGTETAASGQGLLNWHLGDGATCLMRTGGEYADIAPVWNWRRLPGVTCIDTPAQPLPRNVWGKGSEGGSDFAGGVADGETGLAAMELARGGAKARKAWFFTAEGIVCLGAAVRAGAGVPLVTGVEQCWVRGEVRSPTRDVGPAAAGEIDRELRGISWVWHDGVAYLFGQDSVARLRVGTRRGEWATVNTFIHAPGEVRGRVFELALEHAADRVGGYCYTIVPGLAPEGIATYRARTEPRVLRNTEDVQAVSDAGGCFAVWWRPGALDVAKAGQLSVDVPCLVQLRRHGTGWSVAVGNPTHTPQTIRVTWDEAASPGIRWSGEFSFREAGREGAPQTGALRRT